MKTLNILLNIFVCFSFIINLESAVTTTKKVVTTTTKVVLNPCESFPCQKKGECQRINDYDYKCTCDPSISYGTNCQICKYIYTLKK